MADLEAIIQNAVTEASDPEAIIDSPAEETTTEALPDAVGDTPAAEVADPAADTVVPDAPAVVEKDALTLDLEGEGIKSPEVGRDNRIPYTRVKKITENLQKKWTTQHEATVAPIKTELASAKAELAKIEQVNKLIDEDPERYIAMLAVLNPKYKKFTEGPTAQPAKADAPIHDANDPQPQPDGQFPDGTTGYTSEGFEKLLAWRDRQTEKRVLAKAQEDFDKRLGPIEQERKAAAAYQEKIPQVRAQIERAKATWGKLFEDDYALDSKSEILAYMNANPKVPFDQAVAKVLVPKIQADRNAIRESVIKELNSRKPAATVPGTAAKTAVAASGPRDMESVIREAMRAGGLS